MSPLEGEGAGEPSPLWEGSGAGTAPVLPSPSPLPPVLCEGAGVSPPEGWVGLADEAGLEGSALEGAGAALAVRPALAVGEGEGEAEADGGAEAEADDEVGGADEVVTLKKQMNPPPSNPHCPPGHPPTRQSSATGRAAVVKQRKPVVLPLE